MEDDAQHGSAAAKEACALPQQSAREYRRRDSYAEPLRTVARVVEKIASHGDRTLFALISGAVRGSLLAKFIELLHDRAEHRVFARDDVCTAAAGCRTCSGCD